MSDWQVGDVAWCVRDCMEEHCPQIGSAYEVVGLHFGQTDFGEEVLALESLIAARGSFSGTRNSSSRSPLKSLTSKIAASSRS